MRFFASHLHDLEVGLLEHKMSSNVHFHLPRLAVGDVSFALDALCSAGAWVGSSKVLVVKHGEADVLDMQLERLQQVDIVCSTAIGDGSDGSCQ